MIYFAIVNILILGVISGSLLAAIPNTWAMIDRDIMARGRYYQNYRTLEEGQLAVRAGLISTLTAPWEVNTPVRVDNTDCLFFAGVQCFKITGSASYNPVTKSLTVSIFEQRLNR